MRQLLDPGRQRNNAATCVFSSKLILFDLTC